MTGSHLGMPREPHLDRIYTVGHSNHALDRFLRILQCHRVARVVDIRSFPRSRRHPQFDAEPLRDALQRVGLAYEGLTPLGGMRRPRPDSRNLAFPPDGLRGYADHMETREFADAVDVLLVLARQAPTAVLCAEADWRRCHRSLLCDALSVRGVEALHVVGEGHPEAHEMTSHARVEGRRLWYPGEQRRLF